MSTTAPPSPSAVRTPTAAQRRQQDFGAPADRPHRTLSTTTRPNPVPPQSPHRSQSQSHGHARPSSSHHQGNLTNVARRDWEQTNVARPPSSRRSMSQDRSHAPPPARMDSTRGAPRSSSRSGHARHASDASTAAAMSINGATTDQNARPPTAANTSTRRRTTITTPTGQWALGKTIGAGSMGKVKLAKNMDSGEQVAVKIIPRQSTDDHRTAAERERADHSKEIRTAREAAIVSLVKHPYICGMRDVVRTHYHWYMVFEYVNGGQMLDYIISHGRLKEKQARKFGRQIASALDYCHRNSIVHRDLKIENILISKTGDIKIIDFGLSNLFSPRSHLKTFCGSLYFAAPELLQAKQYTGPEVDIWSFGIVLYVLVCGKVPFDDQSMPQLHAKIKKGNAEYPPWLSAECKNLIARMLVTDPRQRATLGEIMNHPWITKGFNAPPENYLPPREPLQLPLDPEVIKKMTGFDFGSPEYITSQLTSVIQSDEYQHAVRAASRRQNAQTPEVEQKRGVFNFYKRRNSTTSRDTLTNPSAETVQLGSDPINAYSPLISVYYLVREKMDREKQAENPSLTELPISSSEKPLRVPDLPAPEAAYTNPSTYEMAGEKPTGGRSRPRARTHGEDEVAEDLKKMNIASSKGPISPAIIAPPAEQPPVKKESTAAGLLRRFSTRRHRDPDREKQPPPPSLSISGPGDLAGAPRKSFSVRRTRDKEIRSPINAQSANSPQPELLSPPLNTGSAAGRKLKALGRSTSVNSGDFRRRLSRRGTSEGPPSEVPQTSGSDRSSGSGPAQTGDAASDDLTITSRPHSATSRAKSLGHARRESIQARRARREMARETNATEATDQDQGEPHTDSIRSPDTIKPVYLKGLFSVSTTSNKPLEVIRTDIIRVLKQLGIEYYEIKGGFSCRHSPSIDLNKVTDESPLSPGNAGSSSHRHRISFGGFRGSDRDRDEFRESQRAANNPKSPRHPNNADRSYTNSDESELSDAKDEPRRTRSNKPRAAGETTTHVQSDLGGSMILKFEIVIVKVPLLTLYGIQFKKVDGGTWQYKSMAQTILKELRL